MREFAQATPRSRGYRQVENVVKADPAPYIRSLAFQVFKDEEVAGLCVRLRDMEKKAALFGGSQPWRAR